VGPFSAFGPKSQFLPRVGEKLGNVESELGAESVTVKFRFGRGEGGDLNFARNVAALLAQETM
jgi:hypothetical protein